MRRYVVAAVDSEIRTLSRASSGRSCATFRAAAAIGGFIGAGEADRTCAENLLLAAAMQTGLSEREAIGHIRRGIRHGEMTPRPLPHVRHRDDLHCSPGDRATFATRDRTVIKETLARPPKTEVDVLWSASQPVGSDPEIGAWFVHRYGSDGHSFTQQTELWNVARAIPRDLHLPRWAWSQGGPWTRTGHRLLFRLWDHTGQAVSVRARCVDPIMTPKSLAPSGFSARNLVLADPLGAQLLAGIVPEWWETRDVVLAEGEPDWLLWSARQPEIEAQGPICFGVEAGAWCRQLADRIPDGARVVIRTHHDEPGERYARQIASSLGQRCQLFRSKVGGEGDRSERRQ